MAATTRHLRFDRSLAAPAADVWGRLVDLGGYGSWNPWIVEARGDIVVGAKLRLRYAMASGSRPRARGIVTEVVDGRVVAWRQRAGMKGLFDVTHRFEVVPSSRRSCRVSYGIDVGGIATSAVWGFVSGDVETGAEALMDALAETVGGRR